VTRAQIESRWACVSATEKAHHSDAGSHNTSFVCAIVAASARAALSVTSMITRR
jgi:hypothetical protein